MRFSATDRQNNKLNNQIVMSTERNTQPYYFLKERRRVKFREVHFLDHPKFGILLTVWPVKLPELPPPTNDSATHHKNRPSEYPVNFTKLE